MSRRITSAEHLRQEQLHTAAARRGAAVRASDQICRMITEGLMHVHHCRLAFMMENHFTSASPDFMLCFALRSKLPLMLACLPFTSSIWRHPVDDVV